MAKLIITEANGMKRDFILDKERVTIGRHPDNDISLNDKAVSGHHAVIITILSDSFLEDLDSTNGTQVNHRQIAKHPLAHGDVIALGRISLRYEGEQLIDEDEFERTQILRPAQLGATPKPVAPAPMRPTVAPAPLATSRSIPTSLNDAPPSRTLIAGKLRVVSGVANGREMELTKALTTIGKPGVQVAAITRRTDGFYIVHVGGQDGGKRPVVNAQEIDSQARRLNQGDTIEIAGTKMMFILA